MIPHPSTFSLRLAKLGSLLGLLLLAGQAVRAQAPPWRSLATVELTSRAIPNIHDRPLSLEVQATATDAAGNVYAVGCFARTVRIGRLTLTSAGDYDAFVAKWNPAGRPVWARRAGGPGEDRAQAVAVHGGNVYVAGRFAGTARFGGTALAVAKPWITADAFVAKLTDEGTTARFVWARQAGGLAGDDEAAAVAVHGRNVYVAGSFASDRLVLGRLTLMKSPFPTRINLPIANAFVAKLRDEGRSARFVWAQPAGRGLGARTTALAVRDSSVFVAGDFSSPDIAFGPHRVASAGRYGRTAFVAKLTDAGPQARFAWALGAGTAFATALAVHGRSVYVAAHFEGDTVRLGTITLTNARTTDGHSHDLLVAKLTDADSAGRFVWAQRAGGIGQDYAAGLAVQGRNVYVAGTYAGAPDRVEPLSLALANERYLFVGKLIDAGPTGAFAWVQQAGSAYSVAGVAVCGAQVHVVGTAFSVAGFGLPVGGAWVDVVGFVATLTDPTSLRP